MDARERALRQAHGHALGWLAALPDRQVPHPRLDRRDRARARRRPFDVALLRTGLRRLVAPAHAAAEPRPTRTGRGASLTDIERVQRLTLNTNA
ncbi:hypothetical protein [Streptomyces lavendulocolor]|uniref:hypothetical protein n=1 Tax=Streptomyces lavendulocolor TaxID=67316 RepID=UPI003C2EC5E1